MPDDNPSPLRPLVSIPADETRELIAIALTLTKGRVRQEAIAREANSAVADRLLEYIRQSGVLLMRPAPSEPGPAPAMRPFTLLLAD